MIAPAPEARIFDGATRIAAPAPGNRGLAYGDGLFETMRAHRGALPWWDAHWARLAQGASRLGIALPEEAFVRAEADALLGTRPGDAASEAAVAEGAVLKLIVVRGGTARGYAPAGFARVPVRGKSGSLIHVNAKGLVPA